MWHLIPVSPEPWFHILDCQTTVCDLGLLGHEAERYGAHSDMEKCTFVHAPWYISLVNIKQNAHAFIVFVPGLDLETVCSSWSSGYPDQ